jgi:hypothetical protein
MTTSEWEIDNAVGEGEEGIRRYYGGGKDGRSKARLAMAIGGSMTAATGALGWFILSAMAGQ